MNALLELADRCEKATAPGRELDADIALTQGWHELPGDNWIGPEAQICVPAYTASLDAAMSLVPEGWRFEVDGGVKNARSRATIGAGWQRFCTTVLAATPALALCAAALRSRTNGDDV